MNIYKLRPNKVNAWAVLFTVAPDRSLSGPASVAFKTEDAVLIGEWRPSTRFLQPPSEIATATSGSTYF